MAKIRKKFGIISILFLFTIGIILSGCTTPSGELVCADDAKECPDGTFVGRAGVNCEFDCSGHENVENNLDDDNDTIIVDMGGDLKKFESKDELEDFLKEKTISSSSDDFYGRGGDMPMVDIDFAMEVNSVADTSASFDAGSQSSSLKAEDYSTTNVQEEGVDEADIVKNDGEYIYGISGHSVYIAKAYPSDELNVVSSLKFDERPQEIFLNDDRLVLFFSDYRPFETISEYDYAPRTSYKDITSVIVYDVSDKKKPQVVKSFELSGSYYDSRMIGEDVYIISKEYNYYYGDIVMPIIRTSTFTVEPDVYYFDDFDNSFNFHTIASFNILSDDEEINAKSFLLGNSNNLYVSENNIYIASQNNNYWGWYRQNNKKEEFFEAVLPVLPIDVKEKIENIGSDAKWSSISRVLEDMYNSMSESKKKKLIEDISDSVEEYRIKLEEERSKTTIHKIEIDNGKIEYKTSGEVKGYLLNQFSFGEYDGYLRVATTFNAWVSGRVQYNNVYVLDENMETVGSLEKIAEDERIYSTRFMGDRLYMVTFKQVDPLFAIDLSNPENPEILGYLKIPGFSDYLHPFDENLLIGIGQDTKENKWGGVTTKGVKISLFDVSDTDNIEEVDVYRIGEEGSYSLAQDDHRSVLFSKEKNLLAIPVREVMEYGYDERNYYREKVFNGLYVLTVDEDGFELRGKISHDKDDESYYWSSPNRIMRSIYMDENLYTVSEKKIMVHDINTIEELSKVNLPYYTPTYNYYEETYDDLVQIVGDIVFE